MSATAAGHPMTARRMVVATSVGAVAAVLTVFLGNWRYAPSVSWAAAAASFCAWIWREIWPLPAPQVADRATAEDPNRATRELVVLTASVASLVALGLVLAYAHQSAGLARGLLALLGLLTVAVSWFTVHTIFMLRYARLYYGDPVGGIDFSQDEHPVYPDFAYLALTIGMTFQVSDTNLLTSAMRRTALQHALLSYLFGSIILATAINLIVSLGVSG